MRPSILLACVAVTAAAVTVVARGDRDLSLSQGPGGPTRTELAFRQDMRKLWTDHVVWTSDYIIAAVDDKPDAEAAAARLMRNQEDIGTAFAEYYRANAGDQLTPLLKEHINIAADLIRAAKQKDDAAVKAANAKWQDNAEAIATFLSSRNPNWPKATVSELMKMHLSTTTSEVQARLNHDWAADVSAYDAVYAHILKMADALSTGIVKQFPARFADR